MNWKDYSKLWRDKHVGGSATRLTREQAARYIAAMTQFEKASKAERAVLILKVKTEA